jgi:hypothetical protein
MLGSLDQFWSPIVQCFATEDAGQIVNSFYLKSHTRNYNHSQLFLTLCHIYTAYNLTCRYSILSCHSLHNTLQIKSSHFENLAENLLREFTSSDSLVEPLLNNWLVGLLRTNWLVRHSSSSYITLNRTSVTAATSQVRALLRHSRKRESHVIFPYSCCRATSPRHVA